MRLSRKFLIALSLTFVASTCVVQAYDVELREKLKKARKKAKKTPAEWTIVTYIQSDNNLFPYSKYNIEGMEEAGATSNVNILIQWDQPRNQKTWRYKIEKDRKIEIDSLTMEMGQNPQQELIDCMKWAKARYPAKHYMLVLWNHGAGIMDLKSEHDKNKTYSTLATSWLQIPGFLRDPGVERGILYDDSDNTFLDNQALRKALSGIKSALGKRLDILGMDACLMGMLEVGYQVKGYVDYLVASQNVQAAMGWSYSGFLKPLIANPTLFSAQALSQSIVLAYADYYQNRDSEFTQSAVDVRKLGRVNNMLRKLVKGINKCKKTNSSRTASLIRDARDKATEFYYEEYIDLDSWLEALLSKTRSYIKDRVSEKGSRGKILKAISYKKRLQTLESRIVSTRSALNRAIVANAYGSSFSKVEGLSIYYPKYSMHSSYARTRFAQRMNWYNFLRNN